MRELGIASLFTVLMSVLYRFWLTYPILQNLTFGQWRAIAVLAAFIIGAVSALVRIRNYVFALAAAVGFLLGGAWAGLSAPHDVPTTFLAEFASHLRSFWRDAVLLILASTISNLCCARLLPKNRRTI